MPAERIDLELNAICNAYRNLRFCLLDTLRLVERDWDGTRSVIAKDVHERVLWLHNWEPGLRYHPGSGNGVGDTLPDASVADLL